jgi:hypothetical protein
VRERGALLKITQLSSAQAAGQLWRAMPPSTALGGRQVLVGTLMPEGSLLDGYERDRGLRVAVNESHDGLALTDAEGHYTSSTRSMSGCLATIPPMS